jgi:hypothetical protein
MLRRVALVRTDVSEELSASFVRVTRIGELGTTLVTASVVLSLPILVTVMKEALISSETSVLTRATRRNIPEDTILHSHRRENLQSYIYFNIWKEGRICVSEQLKPMSADVCSLYPQTLHMPVRAVALSLRTEHTALYIKRSLK